MEEEEKPGYCDVLVPPTLVFCPEHDGQSESVPEGTVILPTDKKKKQCSLQIDIPQLTMLKLTIMGLDERKKKTNVTMQY